MSDAPNEPVPLGYAGADRKGRGRRPWSGSIVSAFVGAAVGLLVTAVAAQGADFTAQKLLGSRASSRALAEGLVTPFTAIAVALFRDRLSVLPAAMAFGQGLAYGAAVGVGVDRRFGLRALAVVAAVHVLAAGAFLGLRFAGCFDPCGTGGQLSGREAAEMTGDRVQLDYATPPPPERLAPRGGMVWYATGRS